MRDENIKDPVSYMREIIRDAFWNARYHERELPEARRKMEICKELLDRLEIDLETVEQGEENDEGDMIINTVEQLACEAYDNFVGSVKHHEQYLRYAHNKIANATALLARCKYPDIDIEEIRRDVYKELK